VDTPPLPKSKSSHRLIVEAIPTSVNCARSAQAIHYVSATPNPSSKLRKHAVEVGARVIRKSKNAHDLLDSRPKLPLREAVTKR